MTLNAHFSCIIIIITRGSTMVTGNMSTAERLVLSVTGQQSAGVTSD